MTKRQLIDEIATINRSAKPSFLAKFDDSQLGEYLHHLQSARTPRMSGDPGRFDHYFEDCPTIPAIRRPAEIDGLSPEETALLVEADAQVVAQQEDEDPPASLDLHVSPNAFFKESYEAKAS